MTHRPHRANAQAFVIWRALNHHGDNVLTALELASAARLPPTTVRDVLRRRRWQHRLAEDVDPHSTRHGDADRLPADVLTRTTYRPHLGREPAPHFEEH